MTRQIFAAEINFEDTPLHVSEKFNDSEKNVKRLLGIFKEKVEEVYILATRNRFTVYIVSDDLTPLTKFFHAGHDLKGYVQYYYNAGEAVTHLMATASGLLSPVKGEGRILNDIIRNYRWALASSTLGITLDHALAKAIDTAKTVRTQTGIDKFCASVVETGLELIYSRLEDLHTKNFLIIGTGKLARLALSYLTREGVRNIAIAGEDHRAATILARKYNLDVFNLDTITACFLKADVILAVSHEDLKISLTSPEKDRLAKQEEVRSRFVVDLGIPPAFDARAIEPYVAEVYHLDDLRRMQESPLESFGGLEAAWRMVMKASHDYVQLLHLLNHSPVLIAYLTRQFTLKAGDVKLKPKRSLRSLLLFKKAESITGTAPADTYENAKAHVNNHVAENGHEVLRYMRDFKKIKLHLCDN